MKRNVFENLPFIPGNGLLKEELLSRYLPPIPDGVMSAWLNKNVLKGSWLLDPFCASPRATVEAARSGYRVLVTANNPISRFLLELAADPPKPNDLKSALAELASSYKANERIEPHIKALYSTYCARCGQLISAEQFLWEQGSASPYSRIYSCPNCGDSGEHACTPFDAEQAKQFSNTGIHKARALERVVSSSDQDRGHVEQALSVYLPRALYGLITIINKLEALNLSLTEKKCLYALLLYAFDQSSTMWRVPGSNDRRRKLTIPSHFREKNIWLSLEHGIDLWNNDIPGKYDKHIPITMWPEIPPEDGGICLYEGRLMTLAESLSNLKVKAICAAIPRPNQAFWTLSALWAGWLWGREAVGTFKSVLHRQRYDWAWHTTALTSVFKQFPNILDSTGQFFGIIGEVEPGYIASALASAKIAGCNLLGIAIQEKDGFGQLAWNCKSDSNNISSFSVETGAASAKSYLESRGEPASYLNTISAALANIIEPSSDEKIDIQLNKKTWGNAAQITSDTSDNMEITPALAYTQAYNAAREALSYRMGFLHFSAQDLTQMEAANRNQTPQETLFSTNFGKISADDEESNNESAVTNSEEKERPLRSSDVSESELIWLRDSDKANRVSATDNYELIFQNYLVTHPGCSDQEIYSLMCERFPGLFTPDPEFIRLLLESYAEKSGDLWHIREEDKPSERQKDIVTAQNLIHQIADRLAIKSSDMRSSNIPYISWNDNIGECDFRFYVTVSSIISEIVLYQGNLPGKGIIVMPGSRVGLLIYKLSRDPRLKKVIDPTSDDWQIIKFRQLKSLAENPLLDRENLDQLLKLDPITYATPQLRMI